MVECVHCNKLFPEFLSNVKPFDAYIAKLRRWEADVLSEPCIERELPPDRYGNIVLRIKHKLHIRS